MPNADRISEAYKGEIWSPPLQRRTRRRIDWLVAQSRGEVLDLGCSQGIRSVLCARRGLRALGVDDDEDRIAYALAERVSKPPEVRERLRFRVADASALDLPDDGYDTVLLGELLERLADPSPVLREVARVAKPDAVVAITTPFGYSPDHDQHRTFFAASLIETLGEHLTVESLELADGCLRVVATPGAMPAEERLRMIAELQPVVESTIVEVQRKAYRLEQRRQRLSRQVENLQARLAAERRELRRIRRGRWWRVRRAMSMLRRRRKAPELPPSSEVEPLPPPRRRGAELIDGADERLEVEIPRAEVPEGPIARPDLTAAVILARFSELAFRYEWRQVQFGPEDWRDALEREQPRLLFVESAYGGNRGGWHGLLVGSDRARKRPLVELVSWCRERGIPTVFWSKEDPPHFERFIDSAGLFDYVFTVDGDCIPRYCEILGHERVAPLPFGAQPRVHNPIAVPGGRVHEVAFAGSYLASKHPARREQMEAILGPAREFGLHIFSRILPGSDEIFEWPEKYKPHIVGSLPYERMVAAYKSYKVFLNVNSVTESPTMCARRVFELAACATPVLSGYSRALDETFGDLVSIARTEDETRAELARLLGDPEWRDRRAHVAMREVLSKHTYGDRVDELLRAIGLHAPDRTSFVSVLLTLERGERGASAIEQMGRQRWRPLQLVIVPRDPGIDPDPLVAAARAAEIEDVTVIPANASRSRGAALNLALDATAGDLIALIDEDSLYEEHYLTDLVQAFSYTDAGVVGKRAHYARRGHQSSPELVSSELEHGYGDRVHAATIIARADVLRRLRFAESGDASPEEELLDRCLSAGVRIYAADRFSFIAEGASEPSQAPAVTPDAR
jgi:spore maturation protein CgeB/2-polyprenyl-3-methyl-5-hydroxy-6-metoxy-1,4-benzoquinol methylase